MTKPIVNYHDLLKLLQIFENDHQLHKETVNVVGRSSTRHHPFKKEKKKNKKKVHDARASKPVQIKKSKSDQN